MKLLNMYILLLLSFFQARNLMQTILHVVKRKCMFDSNLSVILDQILMQLAQSQIEILKESILIILHFI